MTNQTSFLQITGWALLHSLWQMALLWILYQLVTGVFKTKAAFKASLASGFLIGGFGWFVYTVISLYLDGNAGESLLPSFAAGNYTAGIFLQQFIKASAIVYLVLLLLPVSHFIKNYRYVSVIRKYGLSKPSAEWRLFVKKVSAQMDIRKTVHIWISEFVSSPVTVGFFKPVILVPLAAINNLSAQQMEAVLLHELSHIKRHDYFINLIISFIRTILYFNPFVKALAKTVEKEREKHCDEMVLQFQYDSFEYASALLALEKTSHEFKIMTLAASGNNYDLLQRVELILGARKRKSFALNKARTLLAGLLCIVTFNLFLSTGRTGKQIASPVLADKVLSDKNETTSNSIPAVFTKVAKQVNKQKPGIWDAEPSPETSFIGQVLNPAFINVNSPEQVDVPELKDYQEKQVKEAMAASKKVIENVEWKSVENQIAEVLTEKEKEDLKTLYKKEIDKYDWEKLGDKLRVAYDKVDWDHVNEQLASAISSIRADSLQKVYNEALCKVADARKEMSTALKGYTENIKLRELDAKKLELQRSLEKVRAVRVKKIVHL